MKKLQQSSEGNLARIAGFFGLGLLTGLVLLIGVARLTWHSKFYPGLKIAGIEVAGLTREQASTKLLQATENYQTTFVFNGSSWTTPKGMVVFEIEPTLNEVYRYGRRLKLADYLLLLVNKQTNFPLTLAEGKTEKGELLINEIAEAVEIPPIDPVITMEGKVIEVIDGSDGTMLNSTVIEDKIKNNYGYLSSLPVEVPTMTVKRQLGSDYLSTLKGRGEKLATAKLSMEADDYKIALTGEKLVALLSTNGTDLLNKAAVSEYTEGISESLNVEPQDARFEFEEGVVKEFAPGKDGLKVDVEATTEQIMQTIETLLNTDSVEEKLTIAVNRTPPQVTTDKVNELGIKERIGRGESYYAHSIPNRIYNVALASSRLNSALVPPGEEVSFNNLVGEVSGATGYRPAYIISAGRTVLGDGGGLCQVSTTMFRAAMSAGLPILERWGHSYRVSYYELNSKPGVDATVIAPSKDFRFKNDTPGHILIQTINDPKNLHLIIEIYGTSDGRVATLSEPKVWGITPPLPTIYQDDPTLPAGTLRQVDWSAAGAKASFDYKVVRNGETLQDKTFSTTYRSWASVFLRGTGQ